MEDESTVDVHYLKTSDFREVSCDGVIGGPTPSGKLWMGFYTERFPIARVSRYRTSMQADGSLTLEGSGEAIESRQGFIRNVEFGIYLSLEEAKAVVEWLNKNVVKLEGQAQ